MLQMLGLVSISPNEDTNRFSSWWVKAIKGLVKEAKKGHNSHFILVVWEIWKLGMILFSTWLVLML